MKYFHKSKLVIQIVEYQYPLLFVNPQDIPEKLNYTETSYDLGRLSTCTKFIPKQDIIKIIKDRLDRWKCYLHLDRLSSKDKVRILDDHNFIISNGVYRYKLGVTRYGLCVDHQELWDVLS